MKWGSVCLFIISMKICACLGENRRLILAAQFYDPAHKSSAIDSDYVNSYNDEELCLQQLTLLQDSPESAAVFIDASAKLPSGILTGNLNDLGNYHQCLAINTDLAGVEIQGKYCTIVVPLNQTIIEIPQLPDIPELPGIPDLTRMQQYMEMREEIQASVGMGPTHPASRVAPLLTLTTAGITLGVCVPRACSARQAIDFVQTNLLFVNVTYEEYYCRLPNDKPYVAADYVAFVIFAILGLVVLLSTSYDLITTFGLKMEQKQQNVLYRCFSVYTNSRRLVTFSRTPGALDCLDGIRAISMLWVIIGHTFAVTNLAYIENIYEALSWLQGFWSLWITAAPIVVDTFFLISGILVIYAIISKITLIRFVKTLHLFVLNRMMRMFPVLATVVLLQASVFNHVSDGPFWESVALSTERCRKYWWSTLLHVQNYVNPLELCLNHSWYLSVDTQLYIVSPIFMIFLFSRPIYGWISLSVALTISLSITAVFSFLEDYPSAIIALGRLDEFNRYMTGYYISTLTRSPPFVIGMMFGYLLHLYRKERMVLSKMMVYILWSASFLMMALSIFSTYPVIQSDHDNQLVDNLMNAFIRAIWAVAVGWLIFACSQGYGGLVNWILCLDIWKLPARLSYAMYLLHFPLQMVVNGSWTHTKYFSVNDVIYRYFSDVMMTFIAALIICILIDAPFSTLQKLLTGGGGRKPRERKPVAEDGRPNGTATIFVTSKEENTLTIDQANALPDKRQMSNGDIEKSDTDFSADKEQTDF